MFVRSDEQATEASRPLSVDSSATSPVKASRAKVVGDFLGLLSPRPGLAGTGYRIASDRGLARDTFRYSFSYS